MKQKPPHFTCFLWTTALSLLLLFGGSRLFHYSTEAPVDGEVYEATVVEILHVASTSVFEDTMSHDITFRAEVLSGAFEGEDVFLTQSVSEVYFPPVPRVEEGDAILLSYSDMTEDGIENSEWFYMSHNNADGLILLAAGFLLLTILIGRSKGLYAIVSLALSIGVIFLVYIPAILSGQNIYGFTILVCLYIIFSSLLILNGLSKKTLCAIVGNAGGILIAGLVAVAVNALLGITGAIDQDYLFLTMLPQDVSIDLKGLVWASVLIGALGAVMDVAMSIASAMQELSTEMQERTFGRLVRAGMNIGRDAIGTMTNTLILAYVGSSLASLLLFAAYDRSFLILMNFEAILVEIMQATVGSIGILLAVPATVFFAAFLYARPSKSVA